METKILKEYFDYGFGFPVRLKSVPAVKVRGEWTPKIDYNALTQVVLRLLSVSPCRLTGNEIAFIRKSFQMTLKEFGSRFDVSHVAVMKWEKSKNRATKMSWPVEKDIRLFILTKQSVKAQQFAKVYSGLEVAPSTHSSSLDVDMKDLAA